MGCTCSKQSKSSKYTVKTIKDMIKMADRNQMTIVVKADDDRLVSFEVPISVLSRTPGRSMKTRYIPTDQKVHSIMYNYSLDRRKRVSCSVNAVDPVILSMHARFLGPENVIIKEDLAELDGYKEILELYEDIAQLNRRLLAIIDTGDDAKQFKRLIGRFRVRRGSIFGIFLATTVIDAYIKLRHKIIDAIISEDSMIFIGLQGLIQEVKYLIEGDVTEKNMMTSKIDFLISVTSVDTDESTAAASAIASADASSESESPENVPPRLPSFDLDSIPEDTESPNDDNKYPKSRVRLSDDTRSRSDTALAVSERERLGARPKSKSDAKIMGIGASGPPVPPKNEFKTFLDIPRSPIPDLPEDIAGVSDDIDGLSGIGGPEPGLPNDGIKKSFTDEVLEIDKEMLSELELEYSRKVLDPLPSEK